MDFIVADDRVSRVHVRIGLRTCDEPLCIEVLGRNGISLDRKHVKAGCKVYADYASTIRIMGVRLVICPRHIFVFKDNSEYNTSFLPVSCDALISGDGCNAGRGDDSINGCNAGRDDEQFYPLPGYYITEDHTPIELDPPPSRKHSEKQSILLAAGPAFTMAVPILLGGGRKIMITASVIAALWAGANVIYRRRRVKHDERVRRSTYAAYISECEEVIVKRQSAIRNIRMTFFPALDDYFRDGGNPYLLWNRASDDPSGYLVRLGIGDDDFPVEIKISDKRYKTETDSLETLPSDIKNRHSLLYDVPVCIDIKRTRFYAIVTESVKAYEEILSSLILKIAAAFKPDEVQIVISDEARKVMPWIIYLPHCWKNNKPITCDTLFDKCDIAQNARNNTGIVNESAADSDSQMLSVVITSDYTLFSRCMIRHDVVVFFWSDRYVKIPSGMQAIIQENANFSGIIGLIPAERYRKNVTIDHIGRKEAIHFSRRLCKLSAHAGRILEPIPERILLTDILDDDLINPSSILDLWMSADSSDSLSVPIGMREQGQICFLDTHEKGYGPHGLIAGTTGSGKSELLQTLILSLAIHFPPREVSFLLIDYKGGGMANMFRNLPHLAGTISNLSGNMIERAMISIRSENQRRQAAFSAFGVNNIKDYRALYINKIATEPLPHVFIIIDEFAELKREEPEFMQQLISVAQVGRSLGIHLILSTQKPAGCVDDKIWSNSRFRIALKVRDKADSNDMLHRPDAAYITNVGRAYLQVGNDEEYILFQCAYTMAPVGVRHENTGIFLYDEGLNGTELQRHVPTGSEGSKSSQLTLIIDNLCKADALAGLEHGRRLWLDELPNSIYRPYEEGYGMSIPLGIFDDPQNQRQDTYEYNLVKAGNTAVIGYSGCGKSTAIQTVLNGFLKASRRFRTSLYLIDFGGKRLKEYADSRICGGYISEDESERIPMLLGFLRKEKDRRRRIYAGTSFECECTKTGAESAVCVIIDNFGSFMEYSGMEDCGTVAEIMRTSENYGIFFIVTGLSVSQGELNAKIMAQIKTVIPLSLKDKYEYASLLSVPAQRIPAIDKIPGRGMIKIGKRILELQVFVPTSGEEEDRNSKIAHVIKETNGYDTFIAKPYPYIPKEPRYTDFIKELPADDGDLSKGLPIGYDEGSGEKYFLPILHIESAVLISGRVKSGRKTTLLAIEQMAQIQGILTFRPTSVKKLSTFLKTEREDSICLILIDDLGKLLIDFYDSAYEKSEEDFLTEYFDNPRRNEGLRAKIIAVINPKDKSWLLSKRLWISICRRPYGICMGGELNDQGMFDFSFMSYSTMGQRKKAGRGSVALYDDDLFYGNIVIPNPRE